MCGREKEDTDVFTIWFGGPVLPQRGLTRPWLAAPWRQPCPLPAAAPPGLYGRIHLGQGSGGAEESYLYHALASFPKNKGEQSLFPALLTAPDGLHSWALGRRNPSSCFLGRFSIPAPSPGSPHQHSLTGGMHQSQKLAGKQLELHRCQPHLMCMVFTSRQAAVTSQAFPPAAGPGNFPASTVGFPWSDRKSLGPVISLPRS